MICPNCFEKMVPALGSESDWGKRCDHCFDRSGYVIWFNQTNDHWYLDGRRGNKPDIGWVSVEEFKKHFPEVERVMKLESFE